MSDDQRTCALCGDAESDTVTCIACNRAACMDCAEWCHNPDDDPDGEWVCEECQVLLGGEGTTEEPSSNGVLVEFGKISDAPAESSEEPTRHMTPFFQYDGIPTDIDHLKQIASSFDCGTATRDTLMWAVDEISRLRDELAAAQRAVQAWEVVSRKRLWVGWFGDSCTVDVYQSWRMSEHPDPVTAVLASNEAIKKVKHDA